MGTVSSSDKVSLVLALNSGSSVASPGAMGKAVSGFRAPMSPGLVFHPEEGSYILYLFTYEVSTQELIWSRASRAKLSKQQCLSTSRQCPCSHWCWFWYALDRNLTERFTVTVQWSLARRFPRPCLCLPYFHVSITPCVCYNEKILIRPSLFLWYLHHYVLLFPLRENMSPVFLFSPCFLILIPILVNVILYQQVY